ncbi:type IV pilin protein [Hydrogenophaga taeniospiralis]|uniref:type IV pilin protein n=1 Tax=Hydrogenophaga taeniospiralis TaxID=65656 RepID=UPI0021F63349|nr:prepilin-type N-terminal cleavage/methylation domain-containing protein [Hydrogenophaga taeniospiralis]UCU92277.1 prepilin-type N-terminal cleavage/methylation domain-containing protein [Hydrogenophaga taeniospiralis]
MKQQKGFTLIELMIVVAIAAILAAIATPTYLRYVLRARATEGLEGLQAYAARMEQRYQDTGNYGPSSSCAVPVTSSRYFTISCALTENGQGFLATATGTSSLAGVAYTLNHTGVRETTDHTYGVPDKACWTLSGGSCDF